MDTIYALASGHGRAGVAVIRLSGPASHAALSALCGELPPIRQVALRKLMWNDEILDEALIVCFAHNASFTGEEVAEIHLHGGQAVIAAVVRALQAFPSLRAAAPGEFTRRALENGKLELYEVEGLVDLIDAETEAQRRQAQKLLQGDFGTQVAQWRAELLHIIALVEATIDFADEDVPVDVWPEVIIRTRSLGLRLQSDLDGAHAGSRLRSGFEVVIYGPPNVGKSTLINALAKRDAAITSSIAGTTRDIIEVRLDLDGLPVVLLDTAGLRDTDDPLEREGIARARKRTIDADLKVLVRDQAHSDWSDEGLTPDIVVASKVDLGGCGSGDLCVSALEGRGVDQLRRQIVERLARVVGTAGVLTNARHQEHVTDATGFLRQSEEDIGAGVEVEIIAMTLHAARVALEGLIGRIGTEDVLGEIFSRFCIGK